MESNELADALGKALHSIGLDLHRTNRSGVKKQWLVPAERISR